MITNQRKLGRLLIATLSTAAILALSTLQLGSAQPPNPLGNLDNLSPELRAALRQGFETGQARRWLHSDGRIKIYIYPAKGASTRSIAQALRRSTDSLITYQNPWFIEAFLSPDTIESLAGNPAIARAELPTDYSLRITDHRPAAIHASSPVVDPNLQKIIRKIKLDKFWAQGFKGAKIKVGVIDRAFRNLDAMIAAGVVSPVPAERRFNFVDTDSYGLDGPDTWESVHGTSTLEVITSFAPQAELYAIRSLGWTGQFQRAIDKVKELKLDFFLVNMGFVGYPDGNSPFSQAMASAYNSKTLPIGSSNNQALSYTGTYQPNGSFTTFGDSHAEYLDVLDRTSQTVNVYLDWEPGKGADLVLELYDLSGGKLCFIANSDHIGTETHLECYEQVISNYALEHPVIKVRAKKLVNPVKFRVLNFDLGSRFSIVNSATTLTTPSDARNTFTVGAINAYEFSASGREYYSSFGPTADGRIKPDIMGAARLISHTWGDVEFWGTSCATPMVMGTLASYKSANLKMKSSKIITVIQAKAIDCGEPGKDNAFGSGIIRLPKPPKHKKH
jgi:hypothetical protein